MGSDGIRWDQVREGWFGLWFWRKQAEKDWQWESHRRSEYGFSKLLFFKLAIICNMYKLALFVIYIYIHTYIVSQLFLFVFVITNHFWCG